MMSKKKAFNGLMAFSKLHYLEFNYTWWVRSFKINVLRRFGLDTIWSCHANR